MATVADARVGRPNNPLFGPNRLKIGIFGTNVSHGCTITRAPEHFQTTWENARRIAVAADRAGFEALVPVARWKGFGGEIDFNGTCFETFTWAAGLAEATEHIAVFATCHVPTVHPVVAAKLATTADHVSNGRFALNVVCGWFEDEFNMFGRAMMGHEERYAYAEEWLEVVRRLWTEVEPFDHDGRFFHLRGAVHKPKPLQRPRPPVMNAGNSADGRRFMAERCDMAFVGVSQSADAADLRARVDEVRTVAAGRGRNVKVWTNLHVCCRPTEAEARAYVERCFRELADPGAVHGLGSAQGSNQAERLVPGWGGYPLVGTPAQAVERLGFLADAGIDGCLLSWVDYDAGLAQWCDEVLPLMEEAGLRGRHVGQDPQPAS